MGRVREFCYFGKIFYICDLIGKKAITNTNKLLSMNKITKVVLTGGPCAGKTTALAKVVEHFSNLGYQVYTVPEVPTMFAVGGVDYLTKNQSLFYQAEKATLQMQLEIEDRFESIAAESEKPVLLVCDRGTMDISVYLSPETWQAITREVDVPVEKLRDARYDAVLHLVTAADGAAEFYTTSNNEARTEGVDLACSLDKKLRGAWTGHPHLRVISNSENFENKIRRVLREISKVLGLPEPIENERKFKVELVGEIPNAIESDIVQTYLLSEPGTVVRLRKRMMNGSYVYLQTTTKVISDTERLETERNISYNQYVSMLAMADPSRKSIHKIRKSFIWEGQYYELDQFIDPDPGFSVLEMDSKAQGEETKFPPFIKVLEDVTGNQDYYNINLALINA